MLVTVKEEFFLQKNYAMDANKKLEITMKKHWKKKTKTKPHTQKKTPNKTQTNQTKQN